MAPSQLKRLKASLREQGVVGPQKSNRQKKQAAKTSAAAKEDKRTSRSTVLANIREQFNPYEVKKLARGRKFEVVTANGTPKNGGVVGRPGATRGLGEEVRRETLLVEMQRRRKVGGILDQRFGENDPAMTPEERAMERFVKEKQRGIEKRAVFDLEDDKSDEMELTHLGQSLFHTTGNVPEDFNEPDLGSLTDNSTDSEGESRGKKRQRLSGSEQIEEDVMDESLPGEGKLKTKQEVMKEIMAKSKLYKYERQKAREDDDDLRTKLDEGLDDIYKLMQLPKLPVKDNSRKGESVEPSMNADRAALIDGKDRVQADREYDARLRQMAFDARSVPTSRTKTEDEMAAENARRLEDLEEQRLRRMRGEEDEQTGHALLGDEDVPVDAEALPLGLGIPVQPARRELDVEDEDEFVLDDNLLASESDYASTSERAVSPSESSSAPDEISEEEADSISELDPEFSKPHKHDLQSLQGGIGMDKKQAAFTYHCPQSHQELLEITKQSSLADLPTIIQRIRVLYHPRLASENKQKLGAFAQVLVKHISFLTNQSTRPSFVVLEAVIRHIHSLAKSFPGDVGQAFRDHLQTIHSERPLELVSGDFVIFTAIGSTFPTSDHFHQIVTPAMLCIARFLGHKRSHSIANMAKGLYLCTLSAQYQQLSKRYMPEVVNYIMSVLVVLSPVGVEASIAGFLNDDSPDSLRIKYPGSVAVERRMNFWDTQHVEGDDDKEVKISLFNTAVQLLLMVSDLWRSKSAYPEIFHPFVKVLAHLRSNTCASKLNTSSKALLDVASTTINQCFNEALLDRAPLALHNHRPLAIKTAIPKFEESFHPDKHYDADRDRTELSKLRAEHKRERKGALRELRKDASFVARESLREKKERDAEYEKKYRRLVAEVQGEEGREANAYEREKRARKRKAGRT